MKAPIARHEERVYSHTMICVICMLGVLVSVTSLGSMRLYGLYLEHRLADVTRRIAQTADKNSALEERYSYLLSPSRIYTYAKSELRMMSAGDIETIRLSASPASKASIASLTVEEIRNLKGPEGLLGLMVGTANAKN
ncbi:MAG: hypothetical protein LBI74_08860 [Synergistaceae bacterium]|jgi:cell division protein FtsL|nr:hypothetical protein [Synergistaceae bacterium]